MLKPIAIRTMVAILFGFMLALQGCTWFQAAVVSDEKPASPLTLEQFITETNRRYVSPHASLNDWYGHLQLSDKGLHNNQQLDQLLKNKGLLISSHSLLAETHRAEGPRIEPRNNQGVLMPVLMLTRDGYLVPDVEQTEKLYRWLKDDASMDLKSLGASLKLYRAFVAAVVQNCPRPPNNPSPVCQFQSWIGWDKMKTLTNERVYEEKRFREQLKKWSDVKYLVWPQMSVYLNQSAVLMKYAPSSEPLVNLTFEQRKARLDSIKGNARIDFVPVIKSSPGMTRAWCQVKPLILDAEKAVGAKPADIETRLQLMQQGFSALRSFCGKAVTDFQL